jgi:hypothetical protein
MVLSLILLSALPARAQVSQEYRLKAVFLGRLAQFTEWPADAFENPQDPIVICVAGGNPFGDALETAVRGESAHGRALAVRYSRGVDQIKGCHIVYLSRTITRQVKEISAALAGRSVLTVTDAEAAPDSYHPMIRFVTEENHVKLVVDPDAVTAARLVLDPRLLRSAEISGS